MDRNLQLEISNLPKELVTILELIRGEKSLSTGIDMTKWDEFLELSLHHRVYPILFTKLKNLENYPELNTTIQSLTQNYRRNTFIMLHLCGEMEAVAKLFSEEKICPLFLKGPVLAADLYGDISLRTSGDLDILVPFEQLNQAESLLLSQGYEKDEYIESVLDDWKWRHHHFTYFHPTKGVKLEIHWRLNPAPGKEPSFEELWQRKRQSSITSFPVYFLGKEDLFFFLATHGARHGWSRLRWLLDIHQLVEKELNWKFLYHLLEKYQCVQIGGQSLILASNLFHTKLAKEMEQLLKGRRPKRLAQEAIFYLEQMINLHTEPVPRETASYHSRHLYSLMSFQQKCWYWLSVCHPYYTDVETLPLPKKLHFLYYPLRPFLWLWRRSRGHAMP
ncbi:nucleotidyltransferase domain-containing protein [Litchfieldia salsa]|uniref:nucleotidyltransferase domain-containing protein n=1 Tax=Litchfieldia salsa TaxID=930152 RepID=UPI000B8923AD|nr:nucleotidyltransferase family protein [Litchfieldia salsa]